MNDIEIYQSPDNQIEIRVQFEKETVWLSQKQMGELFGKGTDTIGLHLKNIYDEQELEENSTTEFYSVVQTEGKRKINRTIKYYNLDAILSVGYRVNSKRGTQFRQWATQRLKDYLVQGYSINEKLLKQSEAKYKELKGAIDLITRAAGGKKLAAEEGEGILKILHEYSHALDLLDKYDHQALQIPAKGKKPVKKLGYAQAIKQVQIWRDKQNAGNLFGNEKDASFKSSISTIYQTFDGKELYPSLEEKAAHLLYFIVKNHSFTDGNKRIAAGLFAYFLDINGALFKPSGAKNMEDNALVALTLLIAESKPEEKNMMIKVIVNLM